MTASIPSLSFILIHFSLSSLFLFLFSFLKLDFGLVHLNQLPSPLSSFSFQHVTSPKRKQGSHVPQDYSLRREACRRKPVDESSPSTSSPARQRRSFANAEKESPSSSTRWSSGQSRVEPATFAAERCKEGEDSYTGVATDTAELPPNCNYATTRVGLFYPVSFPQLGSTRADHMEFEEVLRTFTLR